MTCLAHALDTLERCTAPKVRGVVRRVQGLAVSVGSLPAPIGAQVVVCSQSVSYTHLTLPTILLV